LKAAVFDLLTQIGLLSFYVKDLKTSTWNLVVAKSKTVEQSVEQEIRQESEFRKCFKTWEHLSVDGRRKNKGSLHQRSNHYNLHFLVFFSLSMFTCFNSHFSGEVILWTLRLVFGSSSSYTGTTGIPAGLRTQCTDKKKLWQFCIQIIQCVQ